MNNQNYDEQFRKDRAYQLWEMLTGTNSEEEWYDSPEDIVRQLVGCGEAAAEVILTDLQCRAQHDDNHQDDEDERDEGQHDAPQIDFHQLGGPKIVPHILRVLRGVGGNTADRAISLVLGVDGVDDTGRFERGLGESGSPRAIRVLVQRLSSGEPQVEEAASAALHRIGADAVPAVCARVLPGRYRTSLYDGISCARWLGKQRDPSALPTLITALSRPEDEIALEAAAALGRIGLPDAVEPLLVLLSPEAPVGAAVITLTTAHDLLFPSVRAAAAWALGRIGDRRALDVLVDAIGTHDACANEEAVEAVAALGGDPRAVLPIFRASLPIEPKGWDARDRVEAVRGMGGGIFGPLVAASAHPEAFIRCLALLTLADPEAASDLYAVEGRREQTMGIATAALGDGSGSVRACAIQVLSALDAPGLADLLLPLLNDSDHPGDEFRHWFDGYERVGGVAARALPDNQETGERVHQALDDGRLNTMNVWRAFNEKMAAERRSGKQSDVRWGEVVAPYVVRAAQGEDGTAINALGSPWMAALLEGLGLEMQEAAAAVLAAKAAEEAAWREERLRDQLLKPASVPYIGDDPEYSRAVWLNNTGELDDDTLDWLAWGDADLHAFPLDLQQAWRESPRAFKAARRDTGFHALPENSLHKGVYADPSFRAAVATHLQQQLSPEDLRWYNAGERVGAMKREAQEAWWRGPIAWTQFLALPQKQVVKSRPGR